jgi:hypothetical protein
MAVKRVILTITPENPDQEYLFDNPICTRIFVGDGVSIYHSAKMSTELLERRHLMISFFTDKKGPEALIARKTILDFKETKKVILSQDYYDGMPTYCYQLQVGDADAPGA